MAELAYKQLKSSVVMSGHLDVYDPLNVVTLAARMHMSRSPLRAAVERLATDASCSRRRPV